MSGQYKIQRDDQDDFSDFRAAHDVAKRGGCWNNIKSCLGLLLLLAICGFISSLFTSTTNGQTLNSRACFHSDKLYTTEPVDVHESNTTNSKIKEKTVTNKAYTVYESGRRHGYGSCWIKIYQGWIIKSSKVVLEDTPTQTPTPVVSAKTEKATTSCYVASKAYITGSMNIRSGPSTDNSKVGSVNSGQSFTVSRSQRGGKYCWLKINKGWIAKTGRVQSTKPPVYSPSSTNTDGLPAIEGSASFRTKIIRAWNYLRDKSPKWYSYVKSTNISVIQESFRTGMHVASRRMEISNSYRYSGDVVVLSSSFVHEACHIYQWNSGKFHDLGQRSRESECYTIQANSVQEYASSYRSYIAELRRYANCPPHVC